LPRNDDALYLAGLVFKDQGDSDRAMEHWRTSLEVDPGRADAHYDLGYQLLLREEHGEALAHLERAVELAPQQTEYRVRLAHGRLLAGEPAKTIETLDQAGAGAALAHRLRGQAYQRLERYREAEAAYQAALRVKPDFAEAYYGLASVAMRLGKREEAAQHQRKFNELKTESQTLGRRMRSEFDPLAVSRRSVARTHSDIARVYGAVGQREKAEALWRRAAELDPGNMECRFHLMMSCQQTGRTAEALRICRELVRAQPNNAIHYLSLGNLLLRQGSTEPAEEAYRKVTALAPKRSEGYFALAQVLLQSQKNLAEARQLALTAARISPSGASYYVLARAQAANADYAAAWAAIEKACALAPQNRQYQRLRAKLQPYSGTPPP
jgi:tetratricopeptide (TPR) repeat protein